MAQYDPKMWLTYDVNGEYAENLKCKVCTTFENQIKGMYRYNATWVNGSTNYKSSNAVDHANSEPH